MIDSRLPESYRLVECDARYAEDALAMLRSILTELAASGREEYYYMSETDDEFRSYYSDPNFITLGVVRQDRLELAEPRLSVERRRNSSRRGSLNAFPLNTLDISSTSKSSNQNEARESSPRFFTP